VKPLHCLRPDGQPAGLNLAGSRGLLAWFLFCFWCCAALGAVFTQSLRRDRCLSCGVVAARNRRCDQTDMITAVIAVRSTPSLRGRAWTLTSTFPAVISHHAYRSAIHGLPVISGLIFVLHSAPGIFGPWLDAHGYKSCSRPGIVLATSSSLFPSWRARSAALQPGNARKRPP